MAEKIKLSIIFICLIPQFLCAQIKTGAECTEDYIPYIQHKNIGIIANQTSTIGNTHLVDSLLALNITIKKIFTPEHGFRGKADAGEHVKNSIDSITGLPIISLYGSNKKPSAKDLQDIDILIFDIQDVGARFYTYISTMHYAMEACAEHNVEFLVLDRPNPNGFYVDGPILDTTHKSFVGMHPIPIVHGMTIGEYARMILGEKWLQQGIQCKLTVILCDKYYHAYRYIPPVPPSPNLPNLQSILLYPVLCLTEGTVLSCGRGTDFPFQVIGHPNYANKKFSFTPVSKPGASKNPPHKNKLCYGTDLRSYPTDTISEIPLNILIDAYKNYTGAEPFFNSFFTKLAGNAILQKQIEQGLNANQIRATWQNDIAKFTEVRKKYLLYPELPIE